MSIEEETVEERKAKILIKLRGYKLVKKEKNKNLASYIVEDLKDKEKKQILIWCVPDETIGIQTINRMAKAMKEAQIEHGILIACLLYTSDAADE